MTFVLASQYHVHLPWVNAHLAYCINSVLNVKALVSAFNQEKALENLHVDLRVKFEALIEMLSASRESVTN